MKNTSPVYIVLICSLWAPVYKDSLKKITANSLCVVVYCNPVSYLKKIIVGHFIVLRCVYFYLKKWDVSLISASVI